MKGYVVHREEVAALVGHHELAVWLDFVYGRQQPPAIGHVYCRTHCKRLTRLRQRHLAAIHTAIADQQHRRSA
jgi:hypothetical protein